MKILIDIGHPAHVHYFKNFIKIMESKGHQFVVTAREKEVAHTLLDAYNIKYINRGKGSSSLPGKLLYIIKGDFIIYKIARKFKPDIFFSFGSPYAAHIAKLMGKPHIAPDDTEHAKLAILSFASLTETILTPQCFNYDFGSKQIRFQGFMELCYLHPNYFKPNKEILNILNVSESEPYAILRFVSWDANHDIGHSGISFEDKLRLVDYLSSKMKVFISSESPLIEELQPYRICIPPEKMHDALSYATLYIGEGGTMASEAAILGTPSIFVNTLTGGVVEEIEEYGLLYGFRNSDGVLEKVQDLLKTPNLMEIWQKRKDKMLSDKIDVTAFMVWFIENYPDSIKIMKESVNFDNQFK